MSIRRACIPQSVQSGPCRFSKSAIAKAASGQYNAAINQMTAFIAQLNDMIANNTLTAERAAPFLEQAEFLIAIWMAQL